MCGRFVLYTPPETLKNRFGLENLLNLPARYNCAPMQELPVIVKNRMGTARWGFRPEWAGEDNPAMAAKMINARSETIAEKPAFRESWAKNRRCLVPMDGFYEWHTPEGGKKQPYFIYAPEGEMLLAAGLWSKVGDQVTFTIMTKPAEGEIAKLHHRMPVFVAENDIGAWFGGDSSLMGRSRGAQLQYYAVDGRVGKVSENDAGLIERLAA